MPYTRLPTDTLTRAWFILVHGWQVSEETRLVILRLLREISTRRSTSKSGTGKDYFIALLEESHEGYLHVIMSKMPQEPQRSRWPQERDVEQSAPTHARHTHCATRQLGSTANQRYDVPWDWFREACQIARVHWGICCKEFCSKEGLHYWIEQSSWNQLECNQVQRALGKLSRSWH